MSLFALSNLSELFNHGFHSILDTRKNSKLWFNRGKQARGAIDACGLTKIQLQTSTTRSCNRSS
jgi:hypothetical protein